MPHMTKAWTPAELAKMNEESFLVDLLDTIKFSPEIGDNDATIDLLKKKLEIVESHIKHRLDAK
ncbi:hypothetical protein IOQ59_15830 [Pontibacterium sp. N1Y112]|uniref:Uncharacterized protein n=1 Tax=Pontibacterium sinense TaxID=2781979 RepID=A0A8J7K091_9GAMM|nr:hypothetical protein [Pontibacterium sinense]MBE9398729.1 hypothetical protein [Pontibacterium sinense]